MHFFEKLTQKTITNMNNDSTMQSVEEKYDNLIVKHVSEFLLSELSTMTLDYIPCKHSCKQESIYIVGYDYDHTDISTKHTGAFVCKCCKKKTNITICCITCKKEICNDCSTECQRCSDTLCLAKCDNRNCCIECIEQRSLMSPGCGVHYHLMEN